MQKIKICSKCKEEKLLANFQRQKTGKDGWMASCKACNIKAARERRQKNVEKYRKIGRNRDKQRIAKKKQEAVNYKGGKCQVCGYNKCLAVLEFHHINPNEKEFDISRTWSRKWETIKKELDKCICVCANCHREIHHFQK